MTAAAVTTTGYLRPASLADAVAMRADHPDWLVLAGATDAMVNAPHRPVPAGIIDVWALAPLVDVRAEGGTLVIGAATPWRQIQQDAGVLRSIPILAAAAREIGALQIQVRGTLGGNVATSSPVGDSLPVLLALDAVVELASMRGRRDVPYRDFCVGYRKTAIAADELIAAVHIPVPAAGTRLHWRKVGTRRAQSISKVMAAAAIQVDGGIVASARLALGAVADRPIRARAAEAAVVGLPITAAADAAAAAVLSSIQPIDDIRSTAEYRLEVAANVVRRFVLASA
jgi:xanthine dehydrogenase small subunit